MHERLLNHECPGCEIVSRVFVSMQQNLQHKCTVVSGTPDVSRKQGFKTSCSIPDPDMQAWAGTCVPALNVLASVQRWIGGIRCQAIP